MRNHSACSLALFAGVAILATGCPGGGGGTTKRLQGAGSSFVDPIMQEWSGLYQKATGGQVNYQSKGSGAGINMMTDREVDFGCSDAPLNAEQLKTCKAKNGDVLHLPLCMGAIVPAYNLEGVPDLVFDGPTLLKIYTGEIANWNDPALAKLNPAAKLPDKKISVAYRSDSSGSTYIFSDYFTSIDPKAWTPGKGTAIKFPVGTASKGNDGVAGFVKLTEGSIGYVELIYALKNSITYGSMVNSRGKTIKASMESVTAAAASATIPDDLRYSIVNAAGEDAYPIAGSTWAIVYVKQPAAKAAALREFLTWVTHDGQKATKELHYAPLPEKIVKMIDEKLKRIEASK
jgi:phosphate ABC transporter phosphate-binding protein